MFRAFCIQIVVPFELLWLHCYSPSTQLSSVWTVALIPVIISCTIMDVYSNTLRRLYVTTYKVSPEFKIGSNSNITRTITSPCRLIPVKELETLVWGVTFVSR